MPISENEQTAKYAKYAKEAFLFVYLVYFPVQKFLRRGFGAWHGA
jgi:hypothetical protein